MGGALLVWRVRGVLGFGPSVVYVVDYKNVIVISVLMDGYDASKLRKEDDIGRFPS